MKLMFRTDREKNPEVESAGITLHSVKSPFGLLIVPFGEDEHFVCRVSFICEISELAVGQSDNCRMLTICHANSTPERFDNYIRESDSNGVGKSTGLASSQSNQLAPDLRPPLRRTATVFSEQLHFPR